MRQFFVLVHVIQRWLRPEALEWTAPREFEAHELQLLEHWYDEKLWKNEGYREKASKLFDGLGWSLKTYIHRHATRDVTITISDMVQFLASKGHPIEFGHTDACVVGVECVLFGRAYPVEYYESGG